MATRAYTDPTTVLRGKTLASTRLATTASTAVYTVAADSCCKITSGVITNTSTTATVAVTLSVVPNGNTDDGTHTIVPAYNLPPGEALPLGPFLAEAQLGVGDFVAVTASVGAVITVHLSGVEGTAT